MIELPRKHISLTRASEFKSACEALFVDTPITFVYYGVLGEDGKNSCMINRPDWHEFYWGDSGFTKNMKLRVKEGVNYWDTSEKLSEQNLCAKLNFNIDNKIEIVNRKSNGYEMLGFGGSANDPTVINFYLNNVEKLKRFSLFFKDKCGNLYNDMMREENRLPLCGPIDCPKTKEIETFNIVKNIKRLENLTIQEVKVFLYTVSGYCPKEIARKLDISYKTVNSYMERIKIKTKCISRSELVSFAKDHHVLNIACYE